MGGCQSPSKAAPATPSLSLALPGYGPAAVYSSTAEPILYFQTTNMPAVEFTLWPLTADEGRRVMHDPGAIQQFKPSLPALRTWTETVRGGKDEAILGSTSLSGIAKRPLAKGYYYLGTTAG